MAYSKQTWTNGPDGGTPLSAARLNHIEDGIEAAAQTADAALPTEGGEVTGVVTVNAVGTDEEPPDVLVGGNTGLNILSSFDGGEDDGTGTDTTGRLNLYSYQRASRYGFGETIRHFLMRGNAKAMIAWYAARENGEMGSGYDENSDPDSDARWVPVAWCGAHWEANDGNSIHGHWSIEVPDSTGAVQTRLEVPFTDQEAADGDKELGVDVTNIRTNLADFTVRATNGQVLRIGAGNSHNKDILLSISSERADSGRRWVLRATNETESGGNAGTNFQIRRYDDTGAFLDAPIHVSRATGRVGVGGTISPEATLHVVSDAQESVVKVESSDANVLSGLILVEGADTDRRGVQFQTPDDTISPFSVEISGKIEWGAGGSSPRDTNLYRSAADTLKTDDSFMVGGDLGVSGAVTSTGNVTVDAAGSAFAIMDRGGADNFGGFQFKTAGSLGASVGLRNDGTENVYVFLDGADVGRQRVLVFKPDSETVFNEDGGDQDLRVEGSTDANLVMVDASTDRVGIGTATPAAKLDVGGKFLVSAEGGPGFYGATPVAKPEVTGSRSDGTALASLLTALATLGLITDSSTE